MAQKQPLSIRERQIVKHICNEKSNEAISKLLRISVSTVDFHRRNIKKKTKIKSVVGLVKWSIRNGLVKI
jgi:DNA-binding CsgD family transcriptional regulator